MNNLKRAIVLGGGGTRGSYQAGFVKAIQELEIDYDIVTGTSIGSLNGTLLVQHQEERLIDLWKNMEVGRVIKGELPSKLTIDEFLKESNLVTAFFKKYVKEKGADVTPLKEMIHEYYDEEKFLKSNIDYGLVTVHFPTLNPAFITKDIMRDGQGEKYLLASSSCFPAFPLCEFDGNKYVDGGYYDNLPIEFAIRLGATEIIAVDLEDNPTHVNFMNRENIKYITPSFSLGSFLNFDKDMLNKNMKLGYLDTMKMFKEYDGLKYTLHKVDKYPKFFIEFYFNLLVYEHHIERKILVSEGQIVSSRLAKNERKSSLTVVQTNLAIMDEILSLIDVNPYHVYNLDACLNFIHEEFEEAFDPNYPVFPEMNVHEIVKYIQSLDKKEIVKKFVNQCCYPVESKLTWQAILNVFSFEFALAMWIVMSAGKPIRKIY